MSLPVKQRLFIQEYLIDLNASAAYMRAGYKSKNPDVDGHKLLVKPSIQKAIKEAMDKRSERTQITADMVLREYAKIGFSNITDYLKVEEKEFQTESGTHTYKTVEIFETDDIDRSKMDAVAEIKQTKEGISLKLHDKKGALDSIARHLGMFVDNSKVEHTGKLVHGHTHDLRKLNSEELRALECILTKSTTISG